MVRSNTLGQVMIMGLALVALAVIFVWQTGGAVAIPGFGDGRVVEKVRGGKRSSELQVGDTIVAINGIKVSSWREAYKILEALSGPGAETIEFTVIRNNKDGEPEQLDRAVTMKRERIGTLVLAGAPKDSKPNVGAVNITAETFFAAAEAGNTTMVEQMLDGDGKKYINEVVDDQTPLIAAVTGGHIAVVQLLLENGADPNIPAADLTTALMKAAESGNRDLVATLMVAGADTGVRNSEMLTAADIADSQGFLDVATFIEDPDPTAFLTAEQRRKIVEPLTEMGVLKGTGYRPTEAELTEAIKEYQRRAELPVSGIVTASSFDDLVRFAGKERRRIETKNQDEETQRTLSRVFSRALTEQWTPVNSTNGYPQCENESITFEISPDNKTITLRSYRPGVTASGLADADPSQISNFRIQSATQIEGWDTIVVKPDPRPLSGLAFQVWEIRDGYMKITMRKKPDEAEPTGRSSFLAMCNN